MSHDFAKKKKKKPKARRKAKVAASTWLLTGIASGLFIAFLTYLAMLAPKAQQAESAATLAATERASSSSSDASDEESLAARAVSSAHKALQRIPVESRELGESAKAGLESVQQKIAAQNDQRPRFEFYRLLPEREVKVKVEAVSDKRNTAEQHNYDYVLQAGSFRSLSDADRLRAKLIMMGLDSSIETNTNDNGKTWHRVIVGPLNNRSKRAETRSTLINQGIDTLVIKRKLS